MESYELAVLAAILLVVISAMAILTWLIQRYSSASPLLKNVLQGTRNLVLPFGTGWLLLANLDLHLSPVSARIAQTLFWVSVIWVSTGVVRLLFFARADESTWRARVPGLFVNLTQVAVILIGAALVIAGVWNQDLGALFATLGVTSIVVGLALQDTLGNLFSGISLLFERPFSTGDWIGVGELRGQVVNMNWRAVHLLTRERDLEIVPNSVLAKEVIHNYSQPSQAHGIILKVGFSYDDPPNDVKKMLRQICEDIPEILPWGISTRTVGYEDFSIVYEIRFFTEDYLRKPEIIEDYMTRIWYATRRHGFTIPFPFAPFIIEPCRPGLKSTRACRLNRPCAGCRCFKV